MNNWLNLTSDPSTALILANETEVGHGKMLEILTQEYQMKKKQRDQKKESTAFHNKSSLVARVATQGFSIRCSFSWRMRKMNGLRIYAVIQSPYKRLKGGKQFDREFLYRTSADQRDRSSNNLPYQR